MLICSYEGNVYRISGRAYIFWNCYILGSLTLGICLDYIKKPSVSYTTIYFMQLISLNFNWSACNRQYKIYKIIKKFLYRSNLFWKISSFFSFTLGVENCFSKNYYQNGWDFVIKNSRIGKYQSEDINLLLYGFDCEILCHRWDWHLSLVQIVL